MVRIKYKKNGRYFRGSFDSYEQYQEWRSKQVGIEVVELEVK